MCATKRDIVLFLGAGFSADAGLPTMAQFGAESDKNRLKWKDDLDYEDAASVIVPAKRAFDQFREWCKKSQATACVDVDNMEAVFCMAEVLLEAEVYTIMLPAQGTLTSVQWIWDRIALWLWKIYQQCPPATEDGANLAKPYDKFLSVACGDERGKSVSVLTTNYDLLFEYFAGQHDVRYSYPLTHGLGRDYFLLPLDGNTSSSLASSRDSIPVCKLHGSVNYFNVPQGNGLFSLGVHDEWTIGDSRRPTLFNVRTIGRLWRKFNGPIPAIIPPTYAKLQGYAWLRKIWHRAFTQLKDAKAIVFIGYSMPESDGFMRAMIQGAMAARPSGKPPRIWVVDPCAKTLKRYEELFPQLKDNERLVQKGFAQAVNEEVFTHIFEEIA